MGLSCLLLRGFWVATFALITQDLPVTYLETVYLSFFIQYDPYYALISKRHHIYWYLNTQQYCIIEILFKFGLLNQVQGSFAIIKYQNKYGFLVEEVELIQDNLDYTHIRLHGVREKTALKEPSPTTRSKRRSNMFWFLR